MSTKHFIPAVAGIIFILLVTGVFLGQVGSDKSIPNVSPFPSASAILNPKNAPEEKMELEKKPMNRAITISKDGFIPIGIKIKVGDSVTFINEDKSVHQVASDPHPTHTDFQPLNDVGILQASESAKVFFDEVGTYKYHDHLKATLKGTIVVE